MKKNLRVIRELVKIRFHNLMVFRLDFFSPFFADGCLFLVQILVFQTIYANVETIGTWEKGEMILYIGTFSLLNAISMTVCFFGLIGIQNKVISGEMDLYLTKPVSPLLRLSFEKVDPGSIPLVLMSLCIIGYGAMICRARIDARSILTYSFWVIVMEILYYEMEVLMRAISFYVISNARLIQLEEACLDLCMKLPGIAFYGIYKVIFYMLLPYGIMATLPVQQMVGEMNWRLGLWGLLLVVVFTFLTYLVWTGESDGIIVRAHKCILEYSMGGYLALTLLAQTAIIETLVIKC